MEKIIAKIREEASHFYSLMHEVYCPYFKETVVFNAEGWSHLHHRRSHQRSFEEQKMRYKLLPLAPEIIRHSGALQEYEVQHLFVEVKMKKRREKILKGVYFFGFIAILNERKVKIIVRQIGNGKKHFWSIIPNWKTRVSKEGKPIFQIHTGNLAQD